MAYKGASRGACRTNQGIHCQNKEIDRKGEKEMKATKDNKVSRYIAQAERYLQQGEKELAAGDLRQAGEKYWGGATQILKAWATAKGIQHNGHAWLFESADKLSEEEKEPILRKQFSLAGMLHTNFYEGWLTKREVEDNASEVKAFYNKIKEILGYLLDSPI
ncbi:MAG: PaREP1 family protein [bacterium]